jgi:SMI1 / KNR4 family (SUKH-1)
MPESKDLDLRGIWSDRDPGGRTNEPLTDDMVSEVEARLPGKLPQSYLTLLRTRNGGYLEKKGHPGVNGEVDAIWGIGRSKAVSSIATHDWRELLNYMSEEGISEPQGLARMVAFSGDGHYFVCFDYNRMNSGEPTIAFVDVELFEPATTIAASFEEFLRGLTA